MKKSIPFVAICAVLAGCVATMPEVSNDAQTSQSQINTNRSLETPQKQSKGSIKGTISEVFTNYPAYLGREGYQGMANVKLSSMRSPGSWKAMGGDYEDPFFKKKIYAQALDHYASKPPRTPVPSFVTEEVTFVAKRSLYNMKEQFVPLLLNHDELSAVAGKSILGYYTTVPDTSVLATAGNARLGSILIDFCMDGYRISISSETAEKLFAKNPLLNLKGQVTYKIQAPEQISVEGTSSTGYFSMKAWASSANLVLDGEKIPVRIVQCR